MPAVARAAATGSAGQRNTRRTVAGRTAHGWRGNSQLGCASDVTVLRTGHEETLTAAGAPMERRHGAVDHRASGRPFCAHARAMTTTGPANVVMNELCAPPAIAFVALPRRCATCDTRPTRQPADVSGPNPDGLVPTVPSRRCLGSRPPPRVTDPQPGHRHTGGGAEQYPKGRRMCGQPHAGEGHSGEGEGHEDQG
jgi:hypothetical protein